MSRQEDDLLKRHALLLEKRHIVVHRGTVKTGVKEEVTEWAVNISSYGTSAYFDPDILLSIVFCCKSVYCNPSGIYPSAACSRWGNACRQRGSPAPLDRTARLRETRAYTYFKDDPEKRSVLSICGSAYEDMAQLVAAKLKGKIGRLHPSSLVRTAALGWLRLIKFKGGACRLLSVRTMRLTPHSTGPIRAESSYAKNDQNRMSARTS